MSGIQKKDDISYMCIRNTVIRFTGGRQSMYAPGSLNATASGTCARTVCLHCIVDRQCITIDHRSLVLTISRCSLRCVMVQRHVDKAQRRELPCVRHDVIEMSSEFQTKPPLVAICVCSMRLRLRKRLVASDVVEPSESWMTAVSIRAPAAATRHHHY